MTVPLSISNFGSQAAEEHEQTATEDDDGDEDSQWLSRGITGEFAADEDTRDGPRKEEEEKSENSPPAEGRPSAGARRRFRQRASA